MAFADLTGRVALVTGGSRGLGRQDCLTLARQGADVVVTDILIESDPELEKTAQESQSILSNVLQQQGAVYTEKTVGEIREMGRKSSAYKLDVTDRANVADVVAKVKEEYGKIDILINNAATLDNVAQIDKQPAGDRRRVLRRRVGEDDAGRYGAAIAAHVRLVPRS